MRISDWSSDVCSSDLARNHELHALAVHRVAHRLHGLLGARLAVDVDDLDVALLAVDGQWQQAVLAGVRDGHLGALLDRLAGAAGRAGEGEIRKATGRERGCADGWISGVAEILKKKKQTKKTQWEKQKR